MPYANNQGVRIHYVTEGKGPALVLQYGQYFPLDYWYEANYVSALMDYFQLILVDARGHGGTWINRLKSHILRVTGRL